MSLSLAVTLRKLNHRSKMLILAIRKLLCIHACHKCHALHWKGTSASCTWMSGGDDWASIHDSHAMFCIGKAQVLLAAGRQESREVWATMKVSDAMFYKGKAEVLSAPGRPESGNGSSVHPCLKCQVLHKKDKAMLSVHQQKSQSKSGHLHASSAMSRMRKAGVLPAPGCQESGEVWASRNISNTMFCMGKARQCSLHLDAKSRGRFGRP